MPPDRRPAWTSFRSSSSTSANSSRHAVARLAAGDAVDAGEEAEVLLDGQVRVQREGLRHVAGLVLDALALRADVAAGDQRAAAGRLQQPAQHLDRRGLAGPVRAEEAEDLTALDAQRELVDGAHLAEATGQAVGDDDGVQSARSFPPVKAWRAPRTAEASTLFFLWEAAHGRQRGVGSGYLPTAAERAASASCAQLGMWPRRCCRPFMRS